VSAPDLFPRTTTARWRSRRRVWHLIGLVARREMSERLHAKSFWISSVLLVVAAVAGVVVPAILSEPPAPVTVAVVGHPPTSARTLVALASATSGVQARAERFATVTAAEHALASGGVACLVVGDQEVVVRPSTRLSAREATLAGSLGRLLSLERVDAELPAADRALLEQAPASVPVRTLPTSRGRAPSDPLAALAASIGVYVLISTYGFRIAGGVAEEKGARVVEVLLAALRPVELLSGKVLGLGLVALGQVALIAAGALTASLATGGSLLHGAPPAVFALAAGWFVVGYAFYCTAYAAAGASVGRQQDVYNLTLPVQLPLLLAYVLAFSAIISGPGTLERVLAWLPPTAPISMVVLFGTGHAGLGSVLGSMALCLLATVAMARLASRVYAGAILRNGQRVSLRRALAREAEILPG
jgi:ABC-2 type transport system permease protein